VGVFFRRFTSRSSNIVRKTFTTYIRPILEYNSNVWNPSKKYLIDQLEDVQRRFIKKVTSLENFSCPEFLGILRLKPIELRRLRYDLIQYYKIFNNLPSLNSADYFIVHQPSLSSHASSSILINLLNGLTLFYRLFCTGRLTGRIRFR